MAASPQRSFVDIGQMLSLGPRASGQWVVHDPVVGIFGRVSSGR